ncbi:hypothetical protein [Rhodopseudomonas sp. AAP120]|nr:hypothetical protein [Rhodopseudomonas sp. AAP120]
MTPRSPKHVSPEQAEDARLAAAWIAAAVMAGIAANCLAVAAAAARLFHS